MVSLCMKTVGEYISRRVVSFIYWYYIRGYMRKSDCPRTEIQNS